VLLVFVESGKSCGLVECTIPQTLNSRIYYTEHAILNCTPAAHKIIEPMPSCTAYACTCRIASPLDCVDGLESLPQLGHVLVISDLLCR